MPPRRVIRRNTRNLGILEVQNNIDTFGTPDIVLKEDFGRDKDLKTLLKTVQPEPFTGEDLDNAKVDQHSEWEKYLPLVEYAYNNTVHTSTRKAPFEVIEGRPKSPLLLKVPPAALYTAIQEKKLLLKQAQPHNFKGEGDNVEHDVEVWMEAMDDYFEAARTHPQNQTMLAMFRLTGDVKIWWKQHCQDSDIVGTSQSWEEIKGVVTTHYLPPAHRATKMNEFFSLRQLSSTLEEYYSNSTTLRRYAPRMALEQQVARFCQGLIEPLNNRLEALRPTTLQDSLLRAKPLTKEIKETTQVRQYYPSKRARLDNWDNGPANQAYQSRPVVATTTATKFSNVKCFECQQYGHSRTIVPRQFVLLMQTQYLLMPMKEANQMYKEDMEEET
ncbi:hypothetical protein L7F22_045751 [Adiantum nelumboides]|nr:hypothetical protein [Adiantum nelumboides]